jgi:hypothetical protein
VWLLLAANGGLLASGPVVFPDGGVRALIASYPFLLLLAALGMAGWMPSHVASAAGKYPARALPRIAAGCGIGLVAMAVVGPTLAHHLADARPLQVATDDGIHTIVSIGPGTPHITIEAPGAIPSSFAPAVRDEDYERYLRNVGEPRFSETATTRQHGPAVLALAYDLRAQQQRTIVVVGPSGLIGSKTRYLRLTGQWQDSMDVPRFSVVAYEEVVTSSRDEP